MGLYTEVREDNSGHGTWGCVRLGDPLDMKKFSFGFNRIQLSCFARLAP